MNDRLLTLSRMWQRRLERANRAAQKYGAWSRQCTPYERDVVQAWKHLCRAAMDANITLAEWQKLLGLTPQSGAENVSLRHHIARVNAAVRRRQRMMSVSDEMHSVSHGIQRE